MKILKYSLLLISIAGLSAFFGCGGDDAPTPEQIIAREWRLADDDPNVSNFSAFRITFSADKTYSITLGGAYNPAYNSCSSTTGTWELSTDNTTLTLSSGGFSSAITIVGGSITEQNVTVAWTTPHVDDEGTTAATDCGDKTTPARTYKLEPAL